MSEAFIRVEDLSYSYDGDDVNASPALRSLSLEINEGEFVAVLGHNGSGKSTFAKLLNMILTPTSGKIYIEGRDITDENMTEEDIIDVRKKVGMVFQNPDNQLVATIVEDDVAFGPENLGMPPEEIRKRVDDVLSGIGMLEYAKREPHMLSGGQKQRIAIAGILAMQPKCIIFDESTAMLDPVGRKEVMESIIRLNKEKNITIVMITHYMEEAAMADRIVVLADGKAVLEGSPDYVFSKGEVLYEYGLKLPQCVELVSRLRASGIKIEGDCSSVEGCVELILRSLDKEKKNG